MTYYSHRLACPPFYGSGLLPKKNIFAQDSRFIYFAVFAVFCSAIIYIYLISENIRLGLETERVKKNIEETYYSYQILEERYSKMISSLSELSLEKNGFVKAEKPEFVRVPKQKMAERTTNIR